MTSSEREPQGASRKLEGYWSKGANDLFAALASSPSGISPAEAAARLQRYGYNTLSGRDEVTAWKIFLHQFTSPIMLILLAATIVSVFLGDTADAIIITVIVLGSAILSFTQEYSAGVAAAKLKAQVKVTACVRRGGTEFSIPADEVVIGDVVLVQAGSLIPADGIVLEATNLSISQAALTGETFPVTKEPGVTPATASLAERTNAVFMGTSVQSGNGAILIVETGKGTVFGEIAARLRLRPPLTEFERGIRDLGYLLTEVMFVLVIAVFAINVLGHKSAIDSLLFSVALAVGLTPQLLPAIITINLARGSQRMAEDGVIVRRLNAIENFGSMDVLCTDKTGTLTEGVIALSAVYDVAGQPCPAAFRLAYLNASLQAGMVNALDAAICAAATTNAAGPQAPDVSGASKVGEIPYDFTRKRLSIAVQEGDTCTLITKGALEPVLGVCTVDGAARAAIMAQFTAWSGQGYRVLGLATRPIGATQRLDVGSEREMTFIGFLLFFDPPKKDVAQTIATLTSYGVQLKIITGDNQLVARHVAEVVGLPLTGVITGHDLATIPDEGLCHAAEGANLFAEVDPNQKERIILALKKMSHVVGYMGDGINDAPPLHAADVGISVSNAADVAKSAADLVLLRQDLSVLARGIQSGRRTFANTLKYVFMAVSANFGNMFSVAGASIFLPFLPMLPKQILLINFMTDFPELTIAGDNVDEVMVIKPRRWDISFIRRFMVTFGLLSSVFDYLTFGVLLLLPHVLPIANGAHDQALFHTTWFTESVLSATGVVLVLRTRLPFFRSRPATPMLIVTAIIGALVILLPYTPLSSALGLTPLPAAYLGIVIVIVVLYLLSAEVAKHLFYMREARREAGQAAQLPLS